MGPSERRRWDPRWERSLQTWMAVCPESDFEHIIWDDVGLRELVVEAFPHHVAAYDAYPEQIQRVDFARSAMLMLHGGLYADMDVEVFRSPFPFFPVDKVSVVASPYQK